MAKLPYAMFFLLPAFALSTSLFYRRHRKVYAEHLLFALHLHAFAYLCLSAIVLIPGEAVNVPMVLVWWVYLALALRAIFGGRLWSHALRSIPILIGHGIVLSIVMIMVLIVAFPSM